MNVSFVSKAGTVPSAKMFFDPGKDHDSPSKQPRQPLDSVIAEAVKKPSLPNFEGLPVDIRVMIYNYILITDADISLRSASEMRTQIGSSDDSKYGIPWQIWHWIGRTIPNGHFLCDFIDMNNGFPTNHAPQFTFLQNAAILLVSRRVNQEATHIFCAKNNFHYSCMRAFPGATIDLLRTVPWPVPFSDRQLYFMRSLSLDYCDSHYNHWTDAAVNDIDNCIARNIIHIGEACPSLKTFSLYIFSRPPLTTHFHGRLGTGHAALTLRKLRKRLDWLDLVSTLPDSAIAVFGQTIAPGAVWQIRSVNACGLPRVTISEWQLKGVRSRWSRGDTIRVSRLDCKENLKIEDAGEKGAVHEA